MRRGSRTRDPEKEAFWRRMIERQRASGLTIRGFCAAEGLSEPSFHGWKRTIAARDQEFSSGRERPRRARNKRSSTRTLRRESARRGNGFASADYDATFMPLTVLGEASRLEIVTPQGWQVRVPADFDTQLRFKSELQRHGTG